MLKIGLFAFIVLSSLSELSVAEDVWLLVDTQKLQLEVKQGERTIKVLRDISIGRNGAGFKFQIGDDITPLGKYRIGWINKNSPYYRFFGFTYPSIDNAATALKKGLIDRKTYNRIVNKQVENKLPPQDTVLGGQIGIHGLGKADERIHKLVNWTHGCIALTNEQIDLLSRWVRKGTRVKIK